jgi:nucleotide-binding universal stress UspA family protein
VKQGRLFCDCIFHEDPEMNIIAATDFSTRSNRALRQAGLLAQAGGAQLHIIHVVDEDQPADLIGMEQREATRVLVEQIASMPELKGVRCNPVVTTGHAFDGILRAAESVDPELIVMGQHRKQVLIDMFVGTTIERVVRGGRYPVLMVNNEAQRNYERVLAPVDMTEAAANSIRVALAAGLMSEDSATILHAFSAIGKSRMITAGAHPATINEYVRGENDRALSELTGFLVSSDLGSKRWSLRAEEGLPMEVINRAVSRMRPDLLVMGTHNRSGLFRSLIGSVTEEALRSLKVDILAVPPARPSRRNLAGETIS